MLKQIERHTLALTISEPGFDPHAAGEPCFILMPVPNITGSLHIGHGINLVLQDLLCRQKKIEGYNVYFPPGADHAGIMGQFTAEKRLHDSGMSRLELGREAFDKFMVSESERHIENLISEMRKLGLKADWSHAWFTHDETRDEYVKEVFLKLYERGLVYREESVVNWCPHCGSCVADMELNLSETRENIHTVRIAPLNAAKTDLIFVQPELLLGSVAVGITHRHPRYAELVGKPARLPFTGKEVKILEMPPRHNPVFDGALRLIVPSYNFDDFDFARANNLPIANIYSDNGQVEFNGTHYAVDEIRELIVSRLSDHDGIELTEFGQGRAFHTLCGTQVRPMVKPQWYLRMHKMEPAARSLLENGRLRFSADFWEQGHSGVLADIRSSVLPEKQKWWEGACVGVAQGYSTNKDWVISRQNWWGQPLPVMHCRDCGHTMPMSGDDNHPRCDVCNSRNVIPDQDVLDVWFSCAIWPFSVNPFGYKGVFADAAVMGQDIFYFWVASANMIGMELYGQPAFKDMLVHGLLCDPNGKKMSKSLGNVISLQEILDEYGTETLRSFVYTVMNNNAGAPWLRAGKDDIATANRCAASLCRALETKTVDLAYAPEGQDSNRILLEALKRRTAEQLGKLHAGEAYQEILTFIRSPDFERARFTREQFHQLLRVIHPFHPFITNHFYRTVIGGRTCLSDSRNDTPSPEFAVESGGEFETVSPVGNLRVDSSSPQLNPE